MAQEAHTEGDVLLFGPVEGRPGGWVPAQLRPLVKQHRQQIDQRAQGAHVAQPRYSGTPVLDPKAQRVLGILVATAVARQDTDVYAIPVADLVAAWPAAFAPLPASPYKGLEAFGQDDAPLFFGRDAMTDDLVAAVDSSGLVPVVGASGAGKSSLVRAGLMPRLAAGRTDWRFAVVRPRPHLAHALAAGFAQVAGAPRSVPVSELEAWQSRIASLGLAAAGDLVLASTGAERLLLVVDQFEEAVDGSPATDEMFDQLAELAGRERSATVAVLTLRDDAFGGLFVRPGRFGEALRRTAVALLGMSAGELSEAILQPARLRGLTVHDHLVRKLATLVQGRPGALPLLEFTLDRMWATLQRGQDALSFEAYAEIGELHGALAEYADGVLAALTPEERSLVRRLFLNHLIAPDQPDVRRVATRTELWPAEWAIAVRLANERLLTTSSSNTGEETVEVVHEALLRAWGTLASWLKEEEPFRNWRRMLAYAMRRHEAGEESAAVLDRAAACRCRALAGGATVRHHRRRTALRQCQPRAPGPRGTQVPHLVRRIPGPRPHPGRAAGRQRRHRPPARRGGAGALRRSGCGPARSLLSASHGRERTRGGARERIRERSAPDGRSHPAAGMGGGTAWTMDDCSRVHAPLGAGGRGHHCAHRRARQRPHPLGRLGQRRRRPAHRPGRNRGLHEHRYGTVPRHRGR
ncbi:AAA family ATPase [Streptomyces sp. GLT-R25]